MRMLVIATGLAAAMGLAACQQSHSDATEAPAPKKDLGRSQVMYQGQEPVLKIDTAVVEPGKTPDSVVLKVTGDVPGPGYSDAAFLPRIYPAPPPDGVYEVDVVATKPAGAMVAQPTQIEVAHAWPNYPAAHLKAVRFMAKGNQVMATVPAAKPAG
ncbi:hypothetical protein [Phenylobacterium sp.]|uniref:hypothetical protein n=1 Tax=Phenylobacterium sp. TaxID=1871053 RepID=UPI002DF4D56D|nr:hypothetical protein [Phenylobacterium sp.]